MERFMVAATVKKRVAEIITNNIIQNLTELKTKYAPKQTLIIIQALINKYGMGRE